MTVEYVAREQAAHAVFKGGSFKIDLEKGFKLAIHQELPDAPTSPFYANLRPEGVKGGTLTSNDFAWIGLSLHQLCVKEGIFSKRRPVCSIPSAGDRFLDAMLTNGILAERFFLIKDESSGKRKFHLADEDEFAWLNTALVDDLVAIMLTKLLAIDAIRAGGGTVTDLIVFLNRSSDAREKLLVQGVRLHAVWEFDHLMEWALGKRYLTRKQYEVIMEYPAALTAYKRSVGYAN